MVSAFTTHWPYILLGAGVAVAFLFVCGLCKAASDADRWMEEQHR